MSSRLIVNSIRHTGASADAITLDSSGNATFPANVTCSGTATGFGGGKILQIVSTTKTDTTSISSSDFANITGMSVSITPSSTSSKIFLIGYVCVSLTDFQKRVYLKITGGNAANYIGAAGTGIEAANVAVLRVNTNYGQLNSPLQYLDSPNTTSAITYQVQWASEGGATGYLNRPVTQDSVGANVASTITVMEVAV